MPINPKYTAGVLDETVGFLIGETHEFYILADSYEGDAASGEEYRTYRSIRNIPKAITLRIDTLFDPESASTPA